MSSTGKLLQTLHSTYKLAGKQLEERTDKLYDQYGPGYLVLKRPFLLGTFRNEDEEKKYVVGVDLGWPCAIFSNINTRRKKLGEDYYDINFDELTMTALVRLLYELECDEYHVEPSIMYVSTRLDTMPIPTD